MKIDQLSDKEVLELAKKYEIQVKSISYSDCIYIDHYDGSSTKELIDYLSQFPEDSVLHLSTDNFCYEIEVKKDLTIDEIKKKIQKHLELKQKMKENDIKYKKEKEAEELKIYQKWKKKLEKDDKDAIT
jgi:hypothetical protein